MPIKTYPDWEEAAENSKQRKAVSYPLEIPHYSKDLQKPVLYRVEIVKPLVGDPYYIFAKTGLRFYDEKCTAADCDKVKKWKSY